MAAPAFQIATGRGFSSANSTTTTGISTPAECSVFVLAHWESTSPVPTISDSRGNAYVQIGATRANTGSYQNWCGVWWCQNASGGSGHTFTAAKTAGYASVHAVVTERANLLTSNSSGSTTSPYPTGSVSPAVDALLAAFWAYQGSTTHTHTLSSGWTSRSRITSPDFWQGESATRSVSAGTYDGTLTVGSGSPTHGSGFILALEAQAPPIPDPIEGDIALTVRPTSEAAGRAQVSAAGAVSPPSAQALAAGYTALGGSGAGLGGAAEASSGGKMASRGQISGGSGAGFALLEAEMAAVSGSIELRNAPLGALLATSWVGAEASAEVISSVFMTDLEPQIPVVSVKLVVNMPDSALKLQFPATNVVFSMPDTSLQLRIR